ncbi:MAG: T9SS type A sorting domain-containing protein [Methanosarcina sp.]
MKRILLLSFLFSFSLLLHSQKDTNSYATTARYAARESSGNSLVIFPIPVRNNNFTIKADKDISFVKVTNIIGQDIYRIKYSSPQQSPRINLENPQRGMYLVTILFSDGTRIVKKIMIEDSK